MDLGFDYFAFTPETSVENHINSPAQEDTQHASNNQPRLRVGGELMGPMLGGLPGRPRLFLQAGAEFRPFSSDPIFELGDIVGRYRAESAEDDIEFLYRSRESEIPRRCEDDLPPNCSTREAAEIEGQGSEIDAHFLNPSWYAALGVAFDVPVAKTLLLQVKPSLAYSGERIELYGLMSTVTEPAAEIFEVYRSGVKTTATDHRLGVGFEMALALSRSIKPIRSSLYVETRCLWLLSDPTTTFSDAVGVASFTVDRNVFELRGGAGLRFSWMGLAGN